MAIKKRSAKSQKRGSQTPSKRRPAAKRSAATRKTVKKAMGNDVSQPQDQPLPAEDKRPARIAGLSAKGYRTNHGSTQKANSLRLLLLTDC